jgi:hypothetical protein
MTGTIDPALFGMPNATNSGVPAGTSLTAYTGPMTITTPGTVIDGKIINGTLTVAAENVTIKNCVVQNFGFWGIDASAAAATGNVTVQNCTLTASSSMDTDSAIVGSGNFIGNNISNCENGIRLTDGASVVRDNYIHDLNDNFGDPHLDGICLQGGQNHVLIEHNTVSGWDTSDIFIKYEPGLDWGSINDITVRNNLLIGDPKHGEMALASDVYVYGPNTTNVTVENNYMEKPISDYVAVSNANPTMSGNVFWDNRTDATPYPSSVPNSPSTPTSPSALTSASAPTSGSSSNDSGGGGQTHVGATDPVAPSAPVVSSDPTPYDRLSFLSELTGWLHGSTAQQVDTSGPVVGTSSVQAIMIGRMGMLADNADTFVFGPNVSGGVSNSSAASAPAQDTVHFSNSAFDSFASVLSRAALLGHHDAGMATGSDTLMLHDTKLDALNHDFRFA